MFKKIYSYTKPFRKTLLWLAVLIAIMAGLKQVEPFISKRVTDLVVEKQLSFRVIGGLLLTLLVVKLIQSGLNRLTWYITNIFVVKFETHLKTIGFDHLMKLSLSFFNDQSTGKVMSKLDRGVNRITNIVNNSGMHFLPSVSSALIAFIIVIQYEWRIAILTVVGFIPYIVINRWRFNKNNVLEKQEYKLYDEQYSHFWEVLNSMPLIKAFRAENYEKHRLKKFFDKYLGLRKEMEANTNKSAVGDLFLEASLWAMYAYIAWITWQGEITIGTMVLLVGMIRMMREPLWQLNWIFWEIKRAQIGAKDFFRIMDVDATIDDPQDPKQIHNLQGKIEFEHVDFTYNQQQHNFLSGKKPEQAELKPSDLEVFKDVSFTIEPGQMTALVGPSGAGKSTIASLIMRFFDPDHGQITLDGVDLKQLDKHQLRSCLGLVSQDSHLFATTIADNLRYAKPDASQDEMWEACRIAYADKFIKQFPNQLETEIGERGVKLSGGQKQRLSIARTILSNPDIIILDEATSSLDSESELYIQRALTKLLANKTSVVIAHRLSTIQQADKIIVLKDNQVYEQGTHQELIQHEDGLYASLFKIQSGQAKMLEEWDLVE
jgi:ABC-type multidrug transport system fused ATPase/permease subunit